MKNNQQPPERIDKRIHAALPIRVTYWDSDKKPLLEMACTYDISARGARVTGLRCVKQEGDVVVVERGRNRAFCRVVWIGEANSELHGQIGIQCVESDRMMWEAELREFEEVYETIQKEGNQMRSGPLSGGPVSNRRRSQRFEAEGVAELMKLGADRLQTEGGLKNLSESGCLVSSKRVLAPGSELKLVLNVGNYDLSIKGKVKHALPELGLGIEFREIRKGDRQVLQFLLRKLAEKSSAGESSKKAVAAAAAR